jgi:hypothetical protein
MNEGRLIVYSIVVLGFLRNGDHIFEQDLKSHAVTATFVGDKELTVAMECAVIETDIVFVVGAVEGDVELVEAEARAVFCVAFCLVQLADHSVVHTLSPFKFLGNKKARGYTRAF